MSSSPRVSVCVPSYNHERFVGAAIQSVLDQDFQDFEIVIVDDASLDGTCAVVESFADPRIRLYRNETNAGSAVTFDRAIERSSGEFICVLASDDLFMPGKLSAQVAVMDRDIRVGAVFSQLHFVDENGRDIERPDLDNIFEQPNRSRAEWLRLLFTQGNKLAAPSAMIRRSVLDELGPHNPMVMQAPDFEYWIRICLKHEIHVIPQRLAGHRIHSDLSNLSAPTVEKQTRGCWEWTRLLRVYLTIQDESFMRSIFPDSRPSELGRLPVSTLLIDPALSSHILPVQLFGLEVLRDILSDDANLEEMARIGFGRRFLFEKCGELDMFGLKAIGEVRSQLGELRATNVLLNSHLDELRAWQDHLEQVVQELAVARAAHDRFVREVAEREAARMVSRLKAQARKVRALFRN